MATGGDIDTSELAELWSEEHVSQLPTFEHFHNIHQIKVEESLDALPAKLYKNPENLPQKSKYCNDLKEILRVTNIFILCVKCDCYNSGSGAQVLVMIDFKPH